MTFPLKRLAAALFLLVATALAQAPPEPKPQFFAGTVTALDQQHIIVTRNAVGRPPVSRSFLIQPTTKLSKALKIAAKVTVRYQHQDAGDVALEVQISAVRRPVKPS